MSVPGQVVGLVERFEADRKTYRSTAYKEQWVRQDFIDPLFEALGWDVVNKSGVPVGPHRGVIPEDAIRVRGATKAPDYGFYLGGARRFFVEAKKPSVNLQDGRAAAFQVRGLHPRVPLPDVSRGSAKSFRGVRVFAAARESPASRQIQRRILLIP